MMSPLKIWRQLLICDFRLLGRKKVNALSPLLFLLVVIAFIPMAVSIPPQFLNNIMLGFLMLFSLFVTNWVLGDFIYGDFEDGTLQFYQTIGHSLGSFFIAKYFFCWLITGIPVVIIATLIGYENLFFVTIGFTLATLINVLVNLMIIICGRTIKKNQMLASFIALPFYLPVLVFNSVIIGGQDIALMWHSVYFMTAMLLFMAPVGILLGTYALKHVRG